MRSCPGNVAGKLIDVIFTFFQESVTIFGSSSSLVTSVPLRSLRMPVGTKREVRSGKVFVLESETSKRHDPPNP